MSANDSMTPDHNCVMCGKPVGRVPTLADAFIAGAKWWEFESTKFTMWPSDQRKAEAEAKRRYDP